MRRLAPRESPCGGGPHQGVVFGVGVAGAGFAVAAGVAEAEGVAELVGEHLFEPAAEVDPAVEALVGDHVGALDGDVLAAAVGMLRVELSNQGPPMAMVPPVPQSKGSSNSPAPFRSFQRIALMPS